MSEVEMTSKKCQEKPPFDGTYNDAGADCAEMLLFVRPSVSHDFNDQLFRWFTVI